MAKRITLIHATALSMQPVENAFREHWPDAERVNLLEDSLSRDRARRIFRKPSTNGGLAPKLPQCGRLLPHCDDSLPVGAPLLFVNRAESEPLIEGEQRLRISGGKRDVVVSENGHGELLE